MLLICRVSGVLPELSGTTVVDECSMPASPKTDLSPKNPLRDKINRGLENALAEAEQTGYVSAKESKQQRDALFRKARAKAHGKRSNSR
jgi:hypothetical protein